MAVRIGVTSPDEVLVFDTGPLSHLARSGWLGALRSVVGERLAVIPDIVVDELQVGVAQEPHLQAVLDASWLIRKDLTSPDEIVAYATFARPLVARGRNRGEAAVLAYVDVHGGTAVIDDGAARKVARKVGIPLIGTLGLLCEAIRRGHLTVALVSDLADHLIESKYHLPFKDGGFATWASENGIA